MKMLKVQDKKGEMEQGKMVAIILVLLLIAVIVILIIIFRQGIFNWMRGLPNYAPPDETYIDMSKLSDAETKSFCPVRVGFYQNAEGEGLFKQYYIFIEVNDEYKQTPFYIAKERVWSKEYSIIRKATGGADPVAANIVDNEIVLKAEFLDSEIKPIDRAWTLKGNLICRKEEPK
ncbi:hypothetical protein HYT26_01205 [Candidatus Pacearchaeota archaeon]|nr:hypothetical protein [Candidatus Pacearchaeota archaeon]